MVVAPRAKLELGRSTSFVILSVVTDTVDLLRAACARVAQLARHVSIAREAIPAYARALPVSDPPEAPDPAAHLLTGSREELAAFWLTLDAINFGSGWFPTLRKRDGRSGYFTIATGLRERFAACGPWTARELQEIGASEVAHSLGQAPDHELMELFSRSLRDLGHHLAAEHEGRFDAVLRASQRSAVTLSELLGGWECYADVSSYDGLMIPFRKRAQLAAADLARAGVARFGDLPRLTMFADNLVPHVLRLDGILGFDPRLVRRIERGELLAHGSPQEVEIRACAVHAVELIVAARPGTCAAAVDQLLWERGAGPRYKASPRHRCRCTAY